MKIKSASHMELQLNFDGENPRILRVPTYWDETTKSWFAFIQTPISKKILSAKGKDSFNLTNNFNKKLKEALNSSIKDEVFEMFKEKKD